ncbi:sodium/glutamate symporter [Texcoconibacillus texcoconensis]|uniref:ESS family glutamate:Na+ symporter n=1 Tax=Texcoconibacillus texcoconensis TaxID=1095777 RepID=A0A840QUV7_9BACI|nr:sodium/glutamate symporter [Texcoconibacillus texcoconensis]MBB5175083.1 ESS family glutamate:Na+ symporter [Texcoconibacillus texcoconensis]
MFPGGVVESGSLNSLLFYLAVLGLILFTGTWLRLRINFFKKYFIPASLIAGFIGLILGPHILGVFPEEMVATWGSLPGVLITIVFAPMLIGMTLGSSKEASKFALPQLMYSYLGSAFQIGVPLLIAGLIIIPLFEVNELFGTVIEIGWAGGHGTAGGMTEVFTTLGWAGGSSVALTSATIGLLLGIFGGMIIINIGVKKGYTSIIKNQNQLKSAKQEDVSEKSANSYSALNSSVIESFGFHASIISIAILIGWVLQGAIDPLIPGLPLFPMAMIGGLIVNIILAKTKYFKLIDRHTLQRIQGLALEFLIVGAIASISIPIVIEYAVPLIILTLVSILVLMWYFFYFGPRMFEKDWFEHSIVNLGTLTGVIAVGLMLLRTVDPEMKTDAATAYALRAPLFSPFLGGGLITALVPTLVITYNSIIVGIGFLIISIIVLVIASLLGIFKFNRRESNHSI